MFLLLLKLIVEMTLKSVQHFSILQKLLISYVETEVLIKENIEKSLDEFVYLKVIHFSQGPVAHICNPWYLGGCNWEDCSLRPAQANSS
jgi:hypothetical protein